MKKMKFIYYFVFLVAIFSITTISFAEDIDNCSAPVWEEYVPTKYQNPNPTFRRGSAIAEIAVGGVLTAFIFPAPIGLPMIYHGTTKLKNISYSKKKKKFNKGLEEAQQISSIEEREKYYNDLIKKCGFSEKNRNKQLKKIAKEERKLEKKGEKIK